MTILERAIENAKTRLDKAKYNLDVSNGDDDTLAKKQRQVEVAEFMLTVLEEDASRGKNCEYCSDVRPEPNVCSPAESLLYRNDDYCPKCGRKVRKYE